MKKPSPEKAACATTAGYMYQPWPKGKPIPNSGPRPRSKRASTKR